MRTFRVRLNGRSYTVSVEQTGRGKAKATIGTEVYECELVRSRGISTWVLQSAKDTVRAHTKALHGHKVDVWLAGLPFPASVEVVGVAGYTFPAEAVVERRVGGEIRALMPGRITSILVKEGDPVAVGAPLLILEAMKMQNEIVAPISGRVARVHVQEGAAVKKDAPLILIE